MFRLVTVSLASCLAAFAAYAETQEMKIGYLRRGEKQAALSLLDSQPINDGIAGARLAMDDNNTTGKFLDQRFSLEEIVVRAGEDIRDGVSRLSARGVSLFITDLDAENLLKAADEGRTRGALLFNAGAIDERLREEECRSNIIHIAPTRSMLADGLAQYLVFKQWTRWLLVSGSHENDKLYASALRRSASRFGAKIVQEKVFEDAGGARRTDSGIAQIQRQIPLFLQGAPDYDVLVAADESEVFAAYLPYRTRLARPVAGSAGLIPRSWDAAHDQWGANQLQNRFTQMFMRRMTPLDGQAWAAMRAIGEATTRTRSGDARAVAAYIKGPDFALAAFKGQKLTLRDWNLQLRQPVLLSDGRMVVSVSPQDGFLHQFSTLDTLGFDRPETKCQLR